MRREDYVLAYIKGHPGCNKTKVVDYMDPPKGKKLAAPNTTYRILHRLIKDNEVICEFDPNNNRIHRLFINDKSDFNRISASLTRTKKFLLEPNLSKQILKAREDWVANDLILQLQAIEKKIRDIGDKQQLNQRIIDMMLKMRYKTVRTVFDD